MRSPGSWFCLCAAQEPRAAPGRLLLYSVSCLFDIMLHENDLLPRVYQCSKGGHRTRTTIQTRVWILNTSAQFITGLYREICARVQECKCFSPCWTFLSANRSMHESFYSNINTDKSVISLHPSIKIFFHVKGVIAHCHK